MTTPPSTDRAAIGHVIDGLIKAGWTLVEVDDRGDENIKVTTKAEAITAITDVDNAFLIVTKDDETGWVWFVLGNEPFEVVCDHDTILSEPIDAVVKPWWE